MLERGPWPPLGFEGADRFGDCFEPLLGYGFSGDVAGAVGTLVDLLQSAFDRAEPASEPLFEPDEGLAGALARRALTPPVRPRFVVFERVAELPEEHVPTLFEAVSLARHKRCIQVRRTRALRASLQGLHADLSPSLADRHQTIRPRSVRPDPYDPFSSIQTPGPNPSRNASPAGNARLWSPPSSMAGRARGRQGCGPEPRVPSLASRVESSGRTGAGCFNLAPSWPSGRCPAPDEGLERRAGGRGDAPAVEEGSVLTSRTATWIAGWGSTRAGGRPSSPTRR